MSARGGGAYHAANLVGGVGLAADREQRRAGGQVDRIDNTLDFGRDRDVVAAGVLAGRAQGVGALRPLRAVGAFAVASLLAGLALVTLVLKTLLEMRYGAELAATRGH